MRVETEANSVRFTAAENLTQVLRARAELSPARTAYTFLEDGEAEERHLTNGGLDRRARAIGARLRSLGLQGSRVLLLYPPGLEYIEAFWGCLYAGAVAVPAYPPRLNRHLERLQAIAADARADAALTTTQNLARLRSLAEAVPALAAARLLDTADVGDEEAGRWREPDLPRGALAFLQYTSGSTAAPKGVMVSHGNLLHNEEMIRRAFGQTEQSVIVGWLPLYHDMGLIGNVLQPLYVGARCVLMSPLAFLQRPLRWLQAVSRYGATTSGGPNFAYDLCVRKVSPAECSELDLSSWSVAFNGAEPVRAETLERFAEAFAPCGFRREAFRPCYGLAEATLLASVQEGHSPPAVVSVRKSSLEANRVAEAEPGEVGENVRALVGCGGTLPGQKLLVVNPETLVTCAPDEVGEVWIGGESVAAGYWNRPDETAAVFDARLVDTGEGPYLRTGDLGFLRGGELFITGRLKDLIIIRGRNFYPHDVERAAEKSHKALRPGCGAAFSVEAGDEERLVVVQEAERHPSARFEEIVESIRQAVVEECETQPHAVVLVRAGGVPKTSSGKIQRRACREMFLAGRLDTAFEWRAADGDERERPAPEDMEGGPPRCASEIAEHLRAELAARLGVEASAINTAQPVTRYGVDSLLATELAHGLESRLGVLIDVADILKGPSIDELAGEAQCRACDRHEAGGAPSAAAQAPTTHPLSHGQRALWFLHRVAPDSAAYNIARAVRVVGDLDADALGRAFRALAERHPSLRTTFAESDGEPVQWMHAGVSDGFELIDASAWDEHALRERLTAEAQHPFKLEEGPLLRARLFALAGGGHVLLVVAHHIVMDFWSLAVLLKELGALYAAERGGVSAHLVPPESSYADYVSRQARALEGPEGERAWRYWERQLGGELPPLDLPTDRPRPPVQTYRGASHPFRLDAGLTRRLKELGREHDATLYVVLLAAFQVLLRRWSGQEDFAVGSPASGRSRAAFSGVVGYFVNPLVMRADLSGDPEFVRLLRRVRRTALDAFAHQDYPFALLVQRLQPERDPSRSPLFQCMFVLQQAHLLRNEGLAAVALGEGGGRMSLDGLELEPFALEQRVAQFDLTLAAAEADGALQLSLEYNTDLFDAATVERMAGHFERILCGVAADSSARVSELPLLTDAERRLILSEWNDTAVSYPGRDHIHRLFERQAARMPGATALVSDEERLTYRELDERADRLARRLRSLGVGPDSLVGVLLERSVGMVVSLLGILKAGGAYVALDPSYPAERLRFMLADSRPPVLLTSRALLGGGGSVGVEPPEGCCVLFVDEESAAADAPDEGAARTPSDDNLAYVIYTSGSTGRPKGAMNTHGAISNRLLWMQRQYRLTHHDAILQKTPFGFDVSVWEFFWPLMTGARLVVAPPGLHRDAAGLAGLIERERVTVAHFVPSMLQTFLAETGGARCESLRLVVCSGEALPFELQERFHARYRAALHNLYGPTEAAVDVTYWACERDGTRRVVPIGRPIANTRAYILDSSLRLVPVGVTGELYIGGAGPGRGYLNRPALTAEKFVPDPLSPEPGARLYRTGDLARYLQGGEIEFLGRIDHQVKVRGFRIELGEIEASLLEHEAVMEAVVVAREFDPGDLRLVAYVVGQGRTDIGALREHLRARLPEYMVPSYFVGLDALPLSPNGKVDRKALPAPGGESGDSDADFVAPRTPVEELLAGLFSELLGVERVGATDNFFELGGHSLLAARVVSRVRDAFGVELPLGFVFESPTVAGLAGRVSEMKAGGGRVKYGPIARVQDEGAAPLSFGQQRLWLLHQLEPDSAVYNIPAAVRLRGPLDVPALERSVGEILNRHEILRTTFEEGGGAEPVQVVAQVAPRGLVVVDLTEVEGHAREAEARRLAAEEARRPFDPARGPLLRASLLRLSPEEHVLLVTMHHIVSDGWSLQVFVEELTALYSAFSVGHPSPLAELPIQYADFARWQREQMTGDNLERLLAYWRERLSGAAPLELPTDFPRPPVQSFRGAAERWEVSQSLGDALKALARREGVTLYMVLLAAFQALLHRYTGQDDIAVGSPVAGRVRPEAERLIGFFANMLVMRTDLSGDPTFRELLARVRGVTLEGHAHHDLPFEKLVEELQPERSLAHAPFFQVALAMQGAPDEALKLRGLDARLLEVETGTTKFDLSLLVREEHGGISGTFEYSADLFEAATVAGMASHLDNLLAAVAEDPGRRLSELPLLAVAERHTLLAERSGASAEYPRDRCAHELFEEQASRSPDALAVADERGRVTYGELNRRANLLARRLRALGVGPESVVGILSARSIEMLVGQLAVLKAGGAYLPLDHELPRGRLDFMVKDAGARFVLAQGVLKERLPKGSATLLPLEAAHGFDLREDVRNFMSGVTSENLAYVIYTSGSTGLPKGVQVSHGGLLNLIYWHRDFYGVTAEDRASVLAGVGFDASVWEVWPYLASGASLHVPDDETRGSPTRLRDWLAGQAITISFLPTPLAEGALSLDWPGRIALRAMLTGGDKLHKYPPASLPFALVNNYGPTENTVVATAGHILPQDASERTPPIGRPVTNTRVYLLDARLQPVPVGVPGEMYIGGASLARGYLGRPGLTAERFIPNPFSAEPGGRLYHTGDLARFLHDGQIEFLGRVDQQVKVRGFRVELGEIEVALASHETVGICAVVARADARGGKRLVAYVSARRPETPPSAGELRSFLKERLPEHMIPSAFVMLDEFPLSPNGKIARKALPAPTAAACVRDDAYAAPRTPVEEMLAGVFSELLGLDRVGADDNFFDLGGHSLLATQIASRVREAFGVELPLRSVFENPTAEGLARLVEAALGAAPESAAPPVVPVGREGALPLSFAQQRLWFLDQLEPGNPAYNIQAGVRLSGRLDVTALGRSLDEIVRRHEALRTYFEVSDGQPVQNVAPWRPLDLKLVHALDGTPPEEAVQRLAEEERRERFDLARLPLLRASLLRLGPDEHVLMLTMHHVIADGWSMGVLAEELAALYDAFSAGRPSPLAELPVQYADFGHWQRERLQGDVLESLLAYWRGRLGGAPPLELPTDFPRPFAQSFHGARHFFALPEDLSESLRSLARREGVTLYMVLLAAFKVLLRRYTGQDDIVVGTDIANRSRAETEGLIGFFTNQLVLRTDLSGDPTFRVLLGRVREVCLGAYAHQDLPFEKLVEELQPERDPSRNPLFQVIFILQHDPARALKLPGLGLSLVEIDEGTTAFDLSVSLVESPRGPIAGSLRYSRDLFKAETVGRLAAHYETLLRGVTAGAESRLSTLEIFTESERKQKAVEKHERQQSRLKKLMGARPKAVRLSEERLLRAGHLSPGQTLPLVLQPGVPGVDLPAWAAGNRESLEGQLRRHGAILFRGFNAQTVEGFERLARAVSGSLMEYGERSSPRSRISGQVYTSTDHPADQHILLHNEQSYTLNWPMKVWFFCVRPADCGGRTPIADSRRVYNRLATATVEKFTRRQVMYVRNYGDGFGLSWQEAFQTDIRAVVEEHCRRASIEFEWKDGGRLRTYQVRPAVRNHPATGETVWFNHALFFNVASLAAPARGALLSGVGEADFPFNTFYGDGSPIGPEVLRELSEAYRAETVAFDWQQGDVLMLDNMLVAHGREPFEGPRRIAVAMTEPFAKVAGAAS